MARQRNKENRVYSSISDERLAAIIASDYARTPSDFSCSSVAEAVDAKTLLHGTSARGIDPMKKWL